jgi:hypothetical protein
MRCIHIQRLVIFVGCLLCTSAQGAPLAVGDAVPAISANDQHGEKFVFTNGMQFLLIATEMAPAKSANRRLAEQGSRFLETNQAAFLMDIHSMPGIARYFAFPKLRKYPQRIVLVDSPEALARFPTQPARVTVLALTLDGHIKKISYWNPDSAPANGCFRW